MLFVVTLVDKGIALLLVELLKPLKATRVTRDQCSPAEEVRVLRQTMRLAVSPGVGDGLRMRASLCCD